MERGKNRRKKIAAIVISILAVLQTVGMSGCGRKQEDPVESMLHALSASLESLEQGEQVQAALDASEQAQQQSIAQSQAESAAQSQAQQQSIDQSIAQSQAESVAQEQAAQSIAQSQAESVAQQQSIAQSQAESVAQSQAQQQSIDQSVAQSQAESVAQEQAAQSVAQSQAESAAQQQSIDQSIAQSQAESVAQQQSIDQSIAQSQAESVAQQQSIDQSIAQSQAESAAQQQGDDPAQPEQTAPSQEQHDGPWVDGRVAYLTFDDGPSYLTPLVLDILDRYNIKATFFVTYQDNPAITPYYNEIVKRGHTIGIHTASHNYDQIYSSIEAFTADFDQIYNYVQQLTGVSCQLYRFPGGSATGRNLAIRDSIKSMLQQRGMIYHDWNVVTGDGADVTADQALHSVVDNILERSHPIILAHDGENKETTIEALPQIIETLQSWGFTFAPLDPSVEPIWQGINW